MNKQIQQSKNIKNAKLSTQPYKGARDFYPDDMRIRNYIFDTWKEVCKRYGFEEYDFPIIEPYEIFAAKTGEEIVSEQMFTLKDRGGRRLAVRPELTPGTVRMLAQRYNKLIKPIKWFMIGSNWRAEKPQKGRGREFYQLEMNTFGCMKVEADVEIFSAMIDIMKEFGANEKQFRVYYSDRKLIKALLQDTLKLDKETQIKTRRIMDKMKKISNKEFESQLKDLGLENGMIDRIKFFMKSKGSISNSTNLVKAIPQDILNKNKGFLTLKELQKQLVDYDLDKYCEFDPSIIRGFDYSDGIVYEVFDMNPSNNRSMFGGERFDKLINIFGNEYEMPSTGFAMGDVTLLEFLKGWDLLPALSTYTKVLVTIFSENTKKYSFNIAAKLRSEGINTLTYLEDKKLDKQLKYADRKNIPYVIIIGPDEMKNDTIQLKDLKEKKQKEIKLEEAIKILRNNI